MVGSAAGAVVLHMRFLRGQKTKKRSVNVGKSMEEAEALFKEVEFVWEFWVVQGRHRSSLLKFCKFYFFCGISSIDIIE